jgi:hypothetical protein
MKAGLEGWMGASLKDAYRELLIELVGEQRVRQLSKVELAQ